MKDSLIAVTVAAGLLRWPMYAVVLLRNSRAGSSFSETVDGLR